MNPLLTQLEKAGFIQVSHTEYRHRDGRAIERNGDGGRWIVTPPGNSPKKKPTVHGSLKQAAESVLEVKR